jgi:hypothetical protein
LFRSPTGSILPEIERILAAHREVSFFAAPTMVKRLVDAGIEPGGLRTLVYGGGPMYHADLTGGDAAAWATASRRSTARARAR